jgi:hypothetical protein
MAGTYTADRWHSENSQKRRSHQRRPAGAASPCAARWLAGTGAAEGPSLRTRYSARRLRITLIGVDFSALSTGTRNRFQSGLVQLVLSGRVTTNRGVGLRRGVRVLSTQQMQWGFSSQEGWTCVLEQRLVEHGAQAHDGLQRRRSAVLLEQQRVQQMHHAGARRFLLL